METRPKKKLLDQVRDAIRLKHYSICTEQPYVNWIKCIASPQMRQFGPGKKLEFSPLLLAVPDFFSMFRCLVQLAPTLCEQDLRIAPIVVHWTQVP